VSSEKPLSQSWSLLEIIYCEKRRVIDLWDKIEAKSKKIGNMNPSSILSGFVPSLPKLAGLIEA